MRPPSPFYFFSALVAAGKKKKKKPGGHRSGGQAGTQDDLSDPTIFSRLNWVLSPAFLSEKAQERFT